MEWAGEAHGGGAGGGLRFCLLFSQRSFASTVDLFCASLFHLSQAGIAACLTDPVELLELGCQCWKSDEGGYTFPSLFGGAGRFAGRLANFFLSGHAWVYSSSYLCVYARG